MASHNTNNNVNNAVHLTAISVNDKIAASRLSIATYNCRGFNFTKSSYINGLLSDCDILLIQEHWLCESQLLQLININMHFSSHAVCGFDSTEVLSGRPYGGCAILWRSDIMARVETIHTNIRRICAIKMYCDLWSILLINVYMPYEDGDERTGDFCDCLSVIEYLMSQNTNCGFL